MVQTSPTCAKKISLTPLHHQSEPLARMDPYFMLFMPNSDSTIRKSQQKSRLIAPFSSFLLSKFGEHVQTVASVSCS